MSLVFNKNLALLKSYALLALAIAAGIPLAAQAQSSTDRYDGYCYAKKNDAQTNGAVIGAVAGAAIGSQVSKHERGLGTVGGAVVGGVIGSQIGKSSVKCYNGSYYAYSGNSYSAPRAPDGYEVLYFRQRPTEGYYDHVYAADQAQQSQYDHGNSYNNPPPPPAPDGYAQNPPYHHYGDNSGYDDHQSRIAGWRDDAGRWHDGRPRAIGWQDEQGQWHVGQVAAYGWRDGRGDWHEDNGLNGGQTGNQGGYYNH